MFFANLAKLTETNNLKCKNCFDNKSCNLIGGNCPMCVNENQRVRSYDKNIDLLSKYGYSINDNNEQRVNALTKASKHLPKLKILRQINSLRKINKKNELLEKLKYDLDWLHKTLKNN
jgi:hypothetical protein